MLHDNYKTYFCVTSMGSPDQSVAIKSPRIEVSQQISDIPIKSHLPISLNSYM